MGYIELANPKWDRRLIQLMMMAWCHLLLHNTRLHIRLTSFIAWTPRPRPPVPVSIADQKQNVLPHSCLFNGVFKFNRLKQLLSLHGHLPTNHHATNPTPCILTLTALTGISIINQPDNVIGLKNVLTIGCTCYFYMFTIRYMTFTF